MIELKPISKEAIGRALQKAERYRMLNEPREAESICRDILRIEPDHQQGLVMLLLAMTDQFGMDFGADIHPVRQVLSQLRNEYEQAYYEGVIFERWAKALVHRGAPRHVAEDWLRGAMSCYEQAEAIRPQGDDDTILRWNTCARILKAGTYSTAPEDASHSRPLQESLDDEVPLR